MQRIVFLLLTAWLFSSLHAQDTLSGKVLDSSGEEAIVGAKIFWQDSQTGTFSTGDGTFSIPIISGKSVLIIQMSGYESDSINYAGQTNLTINLSPVKNLATVDIVERTDGRNISRIEAIKQENIGQFELTKAACCNLSESFETNPSVDVSFSDGVSGARQIKILGLAGKYAMISRENMPGIRGLSTQFGMSFVPGPWIESIQLGKGVGSVINGFESMAGQINVELHKSDRFEPEDFRQYLNLYANRSGRVEGNFIFRNKVGEHWSTATMLHGNMRSLKVDQNQDGFLDNPLQQQVNILHRWKHFGEKGWRSQIAVHGVWDERQGGQVDFDPASDPQSSTQYGIGIETRRVEVWGKTGYVFPTKPWQSFGFQWSGLQHQHKSFYGRNQYSGQQRQAYANALFQSIIFNTNHTYRFGISMLLDQYDEQLLGTDYDRFEAVPGFFGEYTYTQLEKLTFVAGLRLDHHNLTGWFLTPRAHLRYSFGPKTTLQLGGGRGRRTANLWAENQSVLASSRTIRLEKAEFGYEGLYGLLPEVSWNFGISLMQDFRLRYRPGYLSAEYHQVRFSQQVVLDWDQNPQEIWFYMLNGASWSQSLQVEGEYELLPNLNVRLAYRWLDVQQEYRSGLRQQPLVSRNRFFANIGYETRKGRQKGWAFDATLHLQGPKRIPDTHTNPETYQLPGYSPTLWLVNGQITKSFLNNLDVYLGGENLLGLRQEQAILAANDPFGPYFDSAMIWGPIMGRNVYVGLRYKWQKKTETE